MWVANMTRQNIAKVVGDVARHAHSPPVQHWEAVRCILRQLQNHQDTKTLCLTFEKNRGLKIFVSSDSDYARDKGNRRSGSGGVVMCSGTAVSWHSRIQRYATLSSTGAKFVTLDDIIK